MMPRVISWSSATTNRLVMTSSPAGSRRRSRKRHALGDVSLVCTRRQRRRLAHRQSLDGVEARGRAVLVDQILLVRDHRRLAEQTCSLERVVTCGGLIGAGDGLAARHRPVRPS